MNGKPMILSRKLPGLSFQNEQKFKEYWKLMMQNGSFYRPRAVFEVENEEKEPGFPDLLLVDSDNEAIFYEIKVARKGGRFTFEPTQPRFFRSHPNLTIYVVVFDMEKQELFEIAAPLAAQAVLEKGSLTLSVRDRELWDRSFSLLTQKRSQSQD